MIELVKFLAPYVLALACLIGPRFGLDAARCGELLFAAAALINPAGLRPKAAQSPQSQQGNLQ